MNAKRIVRWSIVLFLLLALPGLTAALAQEPQPASKAPLPAVTEMGESTTTIPWVESEHNPNNTVAQIEWFPSLRQEFVWGGTISPAGDVDYWAITWYDDESDYDCEACSEDTSLPILIDIEAVSIGSPADTVICLYSDDGYELSCNDDTDTHDSMIFYNIEWGRSYYLKVRNFSNVGGSAYKYQVLVSVPLLISAAAGGLGTGNVAGIPFQSGDILAWSDFPYGSGQHEEKWVMLFDLSDLNVNGNVTNLAAGWRNSDYLMLGFAANATLPGISGPVTPWEVVTFDPTRLGPVTQGTFQRWWNGKQLGLTLAAEKPDAIDWPVWNGAARLRVSTTGTATVLANPSGNVKLADEDVGLWSVADGKWTRDFDGSLAQWGIAAKDVIAMAKTEMAGYPHLAPAAPNYLYDLSSYYLVLQGTATLQGLHGPFNVNQKDIVEFNLGAGYPGISLIWHGQDHGWNYNIDAIDFLGGTWKFVY